MTKEQKDTLTVRVTSVGFSILTLAIFKPLGIDALGWSVYLHLVAIWLLGIGMCYVTEAILKYLVRMPAAFDKGAEYIIRRNLWFQLINTPLVSLGVCLYLHFVVITSNGGEALESPLTLQGYLTTLLILAFCSFAIGLYWRFKFRSRYLAAELEEIRFLNEELRSKTGKAIAEERQGYVTEPITLTGSTSESITLAVSDLLYVESVGNYVKVYHLRHGEVHSVMLRATSKQMEESLKVCPSVVRSHRAFLVNLAQVERVVSQGGNMQLHMRHSHDTLPVSRSNMSRVKASLVQ